ncbi:neprilysin-4-like [Musca vetustissima]|uniref:neprilysin-4-like n=1 Tax=Musca vetustissima TaxID=27455 RepID=UPI002AB6EA6B|nr:neprilysin-4-like [Musca vetustissima]
MLQKVFKTNAVLFGFVLIISLRIRGSEQSLGQGHHGQKERQLQSQAQQQQQQQNNDLQLARQQLRAFHESKAREMLKFMNLQQEPCNDFYEFSCGKWWEAQNTTLLRGQDRWSMKDVMDHQLLMQVQNILNGPRSSTEYDDTSAKHFYRTCNQASSGEQGEFIKKFVEYYGGLPYVKDSHWQEKQYSWIDVIGQLKHRYNLDILITLTIPRTTVGRAIPIPILEEPKRTVLPWHLCSYLATHEMEEKDEIFNDIQREIKDNLRSWLDLEETDAIRLAGDIQRFEFELCKYMKKRELLDLPNGGDGLNKTRKRYNMVVPNNFHGVMQNLNNNPQSVSVWENKYGLEFHRFVQISLGKGHSIPREFYLRDEEYFQHLNTIARKGLTPSFAYYIMYRALSEITLPKDQAPRSNERNLYCIRKTLEFFPDTLGGIYQNKYRKVEVLNDLRDIFKHVREAFGESIDTNTYWLHDSFRKDIKLRTLSWKLKEPEFRSQNDGGVFEVKYQNNPRSYWQALDAVMERNAQQYLQQLSGYPGAIKQTLDEPVFTYTTNAEARLQFSWSYLQPPYYSLNYPKSLKFSSVGFLMARELIRHYDQQGWHDNPPPLVNAWNFDIHDEFNKIKECFRIQASNYLHNSPNIYRNGSQLRDFVADTSAVGIAFSAYMKWLDDQDALNEELKYETLPGMDFTNSQLFFINYAQMQCAAGRNRDPAAASEYFPLARHTVERLTINGPLWNGLEFGRDFNCPLGSHMNVDDKCLTF